MPELPIPLPLLIGGLILEAILVGGLLLWYLGRKKQ